MTSLCALLIAKSVAPGPGTAGFRGDATHSGVYASTVTKSAPTLKWKFSAKGKVISSPVVVDGVVYVGSANGALYAVDAESGQQKWGFPTGGRIVSSPAVAAGVVYVTSYDGNLYAVDAATGKEKWHFKTKGERRFAAPGIHGVLPATERMPDPFDFFMSSPAVVDGVVFFGSGDTNIYAVDAATGKERWHHKTGDVVHASPAVEDGTVFVGSWDSWFYALDAKTGKQKWKFKTGEDKETYNQVGIQSSAAVVDGVVYFGCRDSFVYALDAKTGAKKWAYSNNGSWVNTSPAVSGGLVFFGTADKHTVHAVDIKTGKDAYTVDLKWLVFSSPAVAGNMLVVGTHGGRIHAVDLTTHKEAWAFETDGCRANVADYTKPDGTFNAAKAFDSRFYDDIVAGISRMMTVGSVLSSPVVVDGVVYFGSTDGNLYAVR